MHDKEKLPADELQDNEKTVLLTKIGHRKEVYR
jgi:mRNA-degrading endonuclease RelE of RelBE toxin-antitoxin system